MGGIGRLRNEKEICIMNVKFKIQAKFRQLSNKPEGIVKERSLFRSTIIALAVKYCGKKWLKMAGKG